VVVVAPGDVERARRSLVRPGGKQTERVVAGGEERQVSVAAGLADVNPACDLVVVHDGARPLVTPELVQACIEAAGKWGASVAALPASDTLKQVTPEGVISSTLDRSGVWMVQTPQVFAYDVLLKAHGAAAEAGMVATDDASLVEHIRYHVHVVPGEPENIKVTWPEDINRCERFLIQRNNHLRRPLVTRSGIGYDAHAFGEGRPLVLAGVHFGGGRGLQGHSDADVVCHAICDAVLGAMGAGDIGQHFPDTDPAYAGISSLSLLSRVAEMARAAGWEIENIDTVVIAEQPRIADRVPEMRRALAEALGTQMDRVNVKGKTTEGLGFTGRQEGIASEAICVLRPVGCVQNSS